MNTLDATFRTHLSFRNLSPTFLSSSLASKYGGATDTTLQRLRYLRDGVLNRQLSPDQAARAALNLRASLTPGVAEDASALQIFADDMRADVLRQ